MATDVLFDSPHDYDLRASVQLLTYDCLIIPQLVFSRYDTHKLVLYLSSLLYNRKVIKSQETFMAVNLKRLHKSYCIHRRSYSLYLPVYPTHPAKPVSAHLIIRLVPSIASKKLAMLVIVRSSKCHHSVLFLSTSCDAACFSSQ